MIESKEPTIRGQSKHHHLTSNGKPALTLAQLLSHKEDGTATVHHHNPLPFVLSFTNLTYSVGTSSTPKSSTTILPSFLGRHTTTKTLLSSVTGEAREGEILAVLGASGSGKSTLIDALASRISSESLGGYVALNGEPLSRSGNFLKCISAHVKQDDLHFPMLTVEETLMFSAEFRLPRSFSRCKKAARVQALIDQLGLRAAAGTIIGDEGHRGVSGGERRRVSIGCEIIHGPILLFLDEPTSGLDSTSAFIVVKVLQRIARSGSIVITSIHQPSHRILGLLDHLILLSRGQAVFSGRPHDLSLFLSDFGHPIPDGENPADVALDLIRHFEHSSPAGTKPLIDFHHSRRLPATLHRPNPTSLHDAILSSFARGKLITTKFRPFANPPWAETLVLTRRAVTNYLRMPEVIAIRLAAVLITGFILATVFRRLDDTPRGVHERLGFLAFAMSTTFYTCADAFPVFLYDRLVFMRETAHNAYRRSSYVLANAAAGLPPLVLLSAAFAGMTFNAVGLSGGAAGHLYYFLAILASFWAGSGFVTWLSAAVPHVTAGYTVAVAVLAYFLLFSGFFVNRDRIPDYWLWFHYLSLVKYPYEGVMRSEFGGEGGSGRCFDRGAEMFDDTPLAGAAAEVKERVVRAISEAVGLRIGADTCVATGRDVLEKEGIAAEGLGKWGCLWVTVAWGFLFRLLFYVALLLGRKNKRR